MYCLVIVILSVFLLQGCKKTGSSGFRKIFECIMEEAGDFYFDFFASYEIYGKNTYKTADTEIKDVNVPVADINETLPGVVMREDETQGAGKENVSNENIIDVAASVFSKDQLLDYNFVMNNFYVVPSVTELTSDMLNLEEIATMDMSIKKDDSVPQILIFHTHSHETFADSDQNGKSIVDAGTYLAELLTEKYGYNVIHLTESFDVVDGVLDRSEAYTYANKRLDEILAENPSIQVVIDLHRDGVEEDRHLVTEVNGKPTAKIMLFNGISYTKELGNIEYLYNPYLKENLAMTYQMYVLGEVTYPDLFRCIYISGYRYCLYHKPHSMLIEAGAQTNTFEEVYNAMEPLADLLDMQLKGAAE